MKNQGSQIAKKTKIGMLIVFVTCLFAAQGALAKQYSLGYKVNVGAESNDNINLVDENSVELTGFTLKPSFSLAQRSETLELTLDTELFFSRFNEDSYESNDQNIKGGMVITGERGSFDLSAGLKRDSTRSSELLDTGRIEAEAIRKETGSLQSSILYNFSELNSMQGGLSYSDVSYASDRFAGYDYASAFLGWLYNFTALTQLRLQSYVNHYKNDASNGVRSDSFGVQFGFDTRVSEKFTLSVLGGTAHIETEYDNVFLTGETKDKSDTYIFTGQARYTAERSTVDLSLVSATDPSGDGYLIKSDRVSTRYSHALSERMRGYVNFTVGQNQALDDRINNDRTFGFLETGLNYRVTENWFISGRYRFRYQDNENLSSANSNGVYLSMSYEPEPMLWAR